SGGPTVSVFDVGPHAGNYVLSAKKLAEVRGTVQGGDVPVRFVGSRLEWHSSDVLSSAHVPIDNLWQVTPSRINGSQQDVVVRYSGDQQAWRTVPLAVRALSQTEPLSGFNQHAGDQIRFRVFAGSYLSGERYQVSLAAEPSVSVRGAPVVFDMPWLLDTAPLFGFDPASLDVLTPRSTITGRAEEYTLVGQRLDTIASIHLGDVSLTRDDWQVSSDATVLTFTAAPSQSGLVSVIASLDSGEQVVLPAALMVTQAIQIDQVISAKTPSDTVSDSAATAVTVSGAGFDGNLQVWLLNRDLQQHTGNTAPVNYARIGSGTLSLSSQGGVAGQQLQVAIARADTREQVPGDSSTWLTVVDDTPPTLTGITSPNYLEPLQIIANESIQVAGFQVVRRPFDYSDGPDVDVSSQFALQQLAPNRWQLRRPDMKPLDHNAGYLFTLTGVTDLAGNPVPAKNYGRKFGSADAGQAPAGEVRQQFLGRDMLAPRNVQLVAVKADARTISVPVDLSALLTRGRSYQFSVTAQDNYADISGAPRYRYRLASRYPSDYSAWQVVEGSTFNIPVNESFELFELKLEVTDRAGVQTEQVFRAGLRDPEFALSGFHTDPTEPEEMDRAILHYTFTGDVDMLKQVNLRVTDLEFAESFNALSGMMMSQDGTSRSGSYSYLNPRLRDLDPQFSGTDALPVPVYFDLRYGLQSAGQRQFQASYPLYRDRTPPTLAIVSPQQGDYIAFDERTDVLIQSFDKYGIDRVEVSRDGGPWQVLEDPRRYSFRVTAEDFPEGEVPWVHIAVRATDSNDNQSEASISLRAYDPADGAPQVSILSPRNGAVLYENEQVQFELALRLVTSATLCLDIGGVEAAPADCTPVSRSAEADERVFVPVTMPQTGEDIVVIARLQSGSLRSYAFLNLRTDDGLAEEPVLTLTPATSVLAGTGIRIRSAVPEGMADFSDASEILVRDPSATAPLSLPMNDLDHWQPVVSSGDTLDVEAVLRDRAGNEKRDAHTLLKQPFLTGQMRTVWQAASAAEQGDHAVETPLGLVWAVSSEAGVRLMTESGEIWSASGDVRLQKLAFSGTALLAELAYGNERRLQRWTPAATDWLAGTEQTLPGEWLGASGDQVWLRLGDSLEAWLYSGSDWVDVAGLSLTEPLIRARVAGEELFALTASGVSVLAVDAADIPKVVRRAFFAHAGATDFVVDSGYFYLHNGQTVQVRERLPEHQGLVDRYSLPIDGSIQELFLAGDQLWASAVTGGRQRWWIYQDDALIGILSDAQKMQPIAGALLVWQMEESGAATLLSHEVDQELSLPSLSSEVSMRPDGVVVALQGLDRRFHQVVFRDGGQWLPAQALTGNRWLLRWADVATSAAVTLDVRQHGRTDSLSVELPALTLSGSTESTLPLSGNLVAKNAAVPWRLEMADSARVSEAQVSDGSHLGPMAIAGNSLWRWQSLPSDLASTSLQSEINTTDLISASLTLVDNDATGIQTVVSEPLNNSQFLEGEPIRIRFRASDQQGRDFRYADISLLDFNNNVVMQTRAATEQTSLTWRAPIVTQREVFTLRVRAYYGEQWYWQESRTGLAVIPRRTQSALNLTLPPAVHAGATVHLAISEPLPAGQTTLTVRDANNAIVARGASEVTFIVPDNTSLAVNATVDNGAGLTQQMNRTLPVLPGYQWHSEGVLAADLLLPDADQLWVVRGRDLLDSEGSLLRRFDDRITGLIRLGDRLLVAVEAQGFHVIDPQEHFESVGTWAATGSLSGLVRYGHRLLALHDGEPQAFHVSGNAITPDDALTGKWRQWLAGNEILQWQMSAEAALVLTGEGLSQVTEVNGSLTGNLLAGVTDGLRFHMVPGGHVIQTDNGDLVRVDARGSKRFRLGVPAGAMQLIGSDLFIADSSQGVLTAVAAGVTGELGVSGRYQIDALGQQLALHGDRLYSAGRVYRWSQTPTAVLMLSDAAADTATSLSLRHGELTAASGLAGAVRGRLHDGQWSIHGIGKPFSTVVEQVASDPQFEYALERDSGLLRIYSRLDQQLVRTLNYSAQKPTQLHLTDKLIVAVAGDTLLLANKAGEQTSSYTPIPGDNIVSVTGHGEVIYIATASRRLFRITGLGVPVVSHEIRRADIFDGGALMLSQLQASGDYLFFVAGETLHRLDLATYQSVPVITDAQIDALTLSQGRLWVALRDATGNRVKAIDPDSLSDIGHFTIDLPTRARALAADGDLLAMALNGGGVRLYHVTGQEAPGTAALKWPRPGQVFSPGDNLSLSLLDSYGLDSVRYYINNRLVSASAQPPFADQVVVPGFLRNGQPFEIVAEASRRDGAVIRSAPRVVLLQGEQLPANPFRVQITEPGPDGISHMPKPLIVRADVIDSTLPVDQVEFYLSETTDPQGAWQIDGKHYGPEYLIRRDYDESYNGRWLKVRAIDMAGNTVESAPLVIHRVRDEGLPRIGPFTIDQPYVVISPGVLVEKHPFILRVSATDTESGVERALLRRNNTIVAAAFGDGDLLFNERTATAGEVLEYHLEVVDRAGNLSTASATFEVIEDTRPVPTLPLRPATLPEQAPFNLIAMATDDVAVRDLRVSWDGFEIGREILSGFERSTSPLAILARDRRTDRIADTVQAVVVVEATDDIGQTGRLEETVDIVVDRVPDASQMMIQHAATDFYGNPFTINLDNLLSVDEALDSAYIAIVDVSTGVELLSREVKAGQSMLTSSFILPTADLLDDNFRFLVRYRDHLGQQDESDVRSVQLTRFPNVVRFNDESGATNPRLVMAGEPAHYRVDVLDDAERPVAMQTVRWTLLQGNAVIDTAEVISDMQGAARWSPSTALQEERYTLQVQVVGFESVKTSLALRVIAGEIGAVRVGHI
ncbi:MAG: hypothetical protein V2I38_06500, partial [Alcanivoracaceae bacterium]|nr:hypothetical protein [Alcanivoracaceae bacterium]